MTACKCICGKPSPIGKLFTENYQPFEYNGAEYVRCPHGTGTLGPQLLRALMRCRDRGRGLYGHGRQYGTLANLGLVRIDYGVGHDEARAYITDAGRAVLAAREQPHQASGE